MRFCMVTTFYPPYNFGGDGIFVRQLARALVELGHQVRVIHCEDAFRLKSGAADPGLPARHDDDGVDVCRLRSPLGQLSPLLTQQLGHPALKTRQLRELLADDFDVINFHNISLVGGPSVLGLGHAPVKLYTLHEHWLVCATHVFWKNGRKPCDSRQCLRCCVRSGIPPQLWRYTGLTQRRLREIDLLLAPSRYTAEQHQLLYPDVPTRVIPLFSRIDPPPDSLARQPREERPRFVYSGRITASKGVESLLDQFSRLPDHELVLAGSGDLLPALRTRYEQYPNIRFAEQLDADALAELYAASVAVILPSLAPETFGLVPVEAMACGTPAIVRDAGGCAEIIESTGAGFVYREADEIPALVRRLAADRDLRERLSAKARAGYERYYTRDRYLKEYLAVVSRLRESRSAYDERGGHRRRQGSLRVPSGLAT